MSDGPNDFYVTWRHVDQTPMEASTRFAGSRDEAVRVQQWMLDTHARQCFYCRLGPDRSQGDNARVVTRIRRYDDIARTIFRYYTERG